ncbi:MAG: hypothetical protein LBS21_13100 [Clostridiales bacterium]|jgi:Zn finger protein HypA/HybF involved in hydrogenase expression|nr:hypothetical protein [Clostridiales bacterium]
MGYISQVSCDKCGYEEEFFLGSGMMYHLPDFVKTLFSNETAAEIEKFKANSTNVSVVAENVLALCETCGKLSVMHKAEFTAPSGETAEFKSVCECGQNFSELSGNYMQEGVLCPKCKAKLRIEETGFWD